MSDLQDTKNVKIVRKHPTAKCEDCPLYEATFVPSYGPDKAKLVIVGEAPGINEAQKGQPFVGSSGKLLDTVLQHHGINREEAFLTNVCLCRPKDNSTPTKAAISCCSIRLQTEIQDREPTQILALGVIAASAVADAKVKITSYRAGPPKQSSLYPNVTVVPTFHPAACLRKADNFPSLVTDVGKLVKPVTITWEPPVYKVFGPDDAAKATYELLNKYDDFVIDIETAYEKDAAFVQPNHYPLLCVGVCYQPNKVVVFDEQACKDTHWRHAFANLIRSRVTCHNGKFDLSGLADICIGRLDFDTMLASYVLDERQGTHKLEYLAGEILGVPNWKHMVKNFRAMPEILEGDLHAYNAIDCSVTWDLKEHFKSELTGDLVQLNNFLLEASDALMQIEMKGIKVNEELMHEVDTEMLIQLEALEKQLAPFVNNPRSPKQVKECLTDMELPVPNTNKETLTALSNYLYGETFDENDERYEFVSTLLKYRKDQKLHGTYVKGLIKRIFQGRLHTSFLLHGTTTGRLSSRNPNLQNIPRGSKIKGFFVAAPGNIFVQADYSQIEDRVVACEAEEPALKEIFADPSRDIFGELALQIFGPDWTKAHRQIVKRIVHGTNYGMQAKTMAAQINSDAESMGVAERFNKGQAAQFQRKFLSGLPKVVAWQKKLKQEIFTEHDDLTTPFGRHRRFWLITNENKWDIEHEGLAFKPQSIASDINLRALVNLHRQGIDLRLSVHDSLMAECAKEDAKEVAHTMVDAMIASAEEYSTYCKFKVEVTTGETWGEC